MAEKKDSMFLEYQVPIESSIETEGDFIIEGIAINETTTSNGHKFLGEELRLAAPTLVGVPLLKNHDNSVDSIVGKVKLASFDEGLRNIPFKAIVKDEKMQRLIKDGLLNTVSVGAHVDPSNIEELENGDIVPHGITFKELSLVAVPADSGATFGVALTNAYNLFKSNSKENSKTNERREDKIESEKEKTLTVEESAVETKVDNSAKILEMLASISDRMTKLESKIQESDVDEAKPESAEDTKEESKEDDSEAEEEEDANSEEVEELGKYKIIEGYDSFGVIRKSYNY